MITQTQKDLICTESKIFPVPDYDNVYVSREGSIVEMGVNGNIVPLEPTGYTKNDIPKFKLVDYEGNEQTIKVSRLMMNTFIGKLNAKIEDVYLDELSYIIEDIVEVNKDTLVINDTEFRRIYVEEKQFPTKLFVSNNGVVYNDESNKFRIPTFQYNFYMRIAIPYVKNGSKRTRNFTLHRLVHETWNDDILDSSVPVNHINGRKNDNYYKNLERSTHLENLHHAMQNNLRYARWTEESVSEVCELLETNKYKPSEIADMLGYSREKDKASVRYLVKGIMTDRVWKHVSQRYDLVPYKNNYHGPAMNDETLHEVCRLFVSGKSRVEIKKELGISQSVINTLLRGDNRPDIVSQYPIDLSNVKRMGPRK